MTSLRAVEKRFPLRGDDETYPDDRLDPSTAIEAGATCPAREIPA